MAETEKFWPQIVADWLQQCPFVPPKGAHMLAYVHLVEGANLTKFDSPEKIGPRLPKAKILFGVSAFFRGPVALGVSEKMLRDAEERRPAPRGPRAAALHVRQPDGPANGAGLDVPGQGHEERGAEVFCSVNQPHQRRFRVLHLSSPQA